MVWPVKDASQEIPNPRLLADVPVSVTRSEGAPVTIASAVNKVWEVKAGDKLTIPLKVTWNNEFTGASISLSPMGADFGGVKPVEIPLKAAGSEVVLDLAALKTPPGAHSLVYLGSAVAKYRFNPEAVKLAERGTKEVRARSPRAGESRQKARRRSKDRSPEQEGRSRE